MGWLSRALGLACDALIGATIVTADGIMRELRDDGDEDSRELLWAIRGGGGNFGVVTEFIFSLEKIGPLSVTRISWPISQAARVLEVYGRVCHEVSVSNTTSAYAFCDRAALTIFVVDAASALGRTSTEEGLDLARELIVASTPSRVDPQTMSYLELNSLFDAGNAPGRGYYWSRSTFLDELKTPLIDQIIRHAQSPPPCLERYSIEIMHLGGDIKSAKVPSSFAQRLPKFEVHAIGSWGIVEGSAQNDEAKAAMDFARTFSESMKLGLPGYLNVDGDTTEPTVRTLAYGCSLQRLQAAKDLHDAENFFHHNHNILSTSRSAFQWRVLDFDAGRQKGDEMNMRSSLEFETKIEPEPTEDHKARLRKFLLELTSLRH